LCWYEYCMYLYLSTVVGSERKAAYKSPAHTFTQTAAANASEYLLMHLYIVLPADVLDVFLRVWVKKLCRKCDENGHLLSHLPLASFGAILTATQSHR